MGLRMHGHSRALALLATSTLIIVSNFPIADAESDEDLLALARKHFVGSISSEQEMKVFEAFFKNVQESKPIDMTPTDQSSYDAQKRDQWGVDRTIKAEWIVWLCKDQIASKKIPPSGIDITGAKIDGEVPLSWTKMQFPLRASVCYFTDRLILTGASLRGLYLANAYIKGSDIKGSDIKKSYQESLDDGGLNVERDVVFDNFEAERPVSLRSATITGEFIAPHARFHTASTSYSDFIEPALDLSSAKIGSKVGSI
jgi:hypothetical protein